MEADVAIHPMGVDQWAAMQEISYTPTGNVGYFFHDFSGGSRPHTRRTDRKKLQGMRGQMKVSRSYDNELKSATKDVSRNLDQDGEQSNSLDRVKPPTVWTIPASHFNNYNDEEIPTKQSSKCSPSSKRKAKKKRWRADSESSRMAIPRCDIQNEEILSSVATSEMLMKEAEELTREVFKQEKLVRYTDKFSDRLDALEIAKRPGHSMILQIKDGPMLMYKSSSHIISDPDEGIIRSENSEALAAQNSGKGVADKKLSHTTSPYDNCAPSSKGIAKPKNQTSPLKFDSSYSPSSPKLNRRGQPAEAKLSGLPLPSPKAKRKTGTSSLPNAKSNKSRLKKHSSSQDDILSSFVPTVSGARSDSLLQSTGRSRSHSGSRIPTGKSGIPKPKSGIPRLTHSPTTGIPKPLNSPTVTGIPKSKNPPNAAVARVKPELSSTPNSEASSCPPDIESFTTDISTATPRRIPRSPILPKRSKRSRTVSESSVKLDFVIDEPTLVSKAESPMTSRETPLTSRETSLTSRETPLTSRETPLTSRETPLTSRETPLTSRETGDSLFNTGFEDTSFMVQRRAGIRHDDIVVGPRRSFKSESDVLDNNTSNIDTIQHSHTLGDMPDNSIVENLKLDVTSETTLLSNSKTNESQGRWRRKSKQKARRGTGQGDVSTESGYATDVRSDTSGCINDSFGPHTDLQSEVPYDPNVAVIEASSSNSYINLKDALQLDIIEKSRIPSVEKCVQEKRPKNKTKKFGNKTSKNNPFLNMHISVPMTYDPPGTVIEPSTSEVPDKPCKPLTVPSVPNNENPAEPEISKDLYKKEVCSPLGNLVSHTANIIETSKKPDCSSNQISFEKEHSTSINSYTNKSHESINSINSGPNDSQLSTTKCSPESSFDISKAGEPPLFHNSKQSDTDDINTHLKTLSSNRPHLKPRLHRSAENLLRDTKRMFKSSDNIKNVDEKQPLLPVDTVNLPRSLKKGTNTSELVSVKSTATTPSTPHPESTSASVSSRASSPRRLSPFKKKSHKTATASPVLGIIRRESERSEIRRRGSDRAKLLRRNDPSVEDLKKATSLRELCQSMASLLQIDDETAAEMLSAPLSQRRDLVDGLDADAILDYLTHHGVLDTSKVPCVGPGGDKAQRNSAIVRQVEASGKTAVALFINALRQSGQLHLASSLDTEQRIQPVSGQGYFGKPRHKGEVSIQIIVEALKVLAPREPRGDPAINQSLLEREARRVEDIEEEEDIEPTSCWCFCFSKKSKASKISKKNGDKKSKQKYEEVGEKDIKASGQKLENQTDPNTKPHRSKSKDKKEKNDFGPNDSKHSSSGKASNQKKTKKSKNKSKADCSKDSNLTSPPPSVISSVPDVVFSSDLGKPSFRRPNELYDISEDQSFSNNQTKKADGFDPIVMEYDPQLELVKLREGPEELESPTRQAGETGIMVEQWKSEGRFFTPKACRLCERVVEDFHVDMVKYFEQDRGTLVLDILAEDCSIVVFNICMKRDQVSKLEQDVHDGQLLTRLEKSFLSKIDLSPWDIRGVKFKVVLDDEQVKTAITELS